MEEEENLTIEDIKKFLYERHSVNTQVIDWRRKSRGEEKKLLDVSAKQKTLVPPWILSKLSRIRKKFYLNCDIDTATVYNIEVQRAARHFTMTPAETQKWRKRVEKTFNDVKPLVVEENNSKDVENVPPIKDEEDTKKISDIGVPSTCSRHAKQYASSDKSRPCSNKIYTHEEKEENTVCKDFAEKNVIGNLKNETNHAISTKDCSIDAVVKEDSDTIIGLPDVPEKDPNTEIELILPDVPDEIPW